MKLFLLIIEDDSAIVNDWKQKLELYETESNPVYEIVPTFITELVEAKSLLLNSFFDAAVIDIRLESSDGELNDDGNELFQLIATSSLTVSAIYTGEPEIVELDDRQREFAKIFEKGHGDINAILNWLDDKASMIFSIKEMNKSIKYEMAKVFSKSIWPRWEKWLEGEVNRDFTTKALTRHMATHLHALYLNDELGTHPEEYYFIPPLRDQLDTGDIFCQGEEYFILVTPRCDLARETNQTFQLVKLKSIKEKWDTSQSNKVEGVNRKAKDQAVKDLRNMVNHGDRSPKLHFIPQIKRSDDDILGPFHAHFNAMKCIAVDDTTRTNLKAQRIATLSNEFVPSLVERLGAYFSRIGTPDYSHPE